jgi:hypothetical protein
MARRARGKEVLALARQQLARAPDADELRILQAVALPLTQGLSARDAETVAGRSPRRVTAARNGHIRAPGCPRKAPEEIRNNAYLPTTEEKDFLVTFLEKACCGGVPEVSALHRALEERPGRRVASATTYNLLHRQVGANWRRISVMPLPMRKRKKSGKKLPERPARIAKERERPGAPRLVFQDEARFGRIAPRRRCGRPKPERPACPPSSVKTMHTPGEPYRWRTVSGTA